MNKNKGHIIKNVKPGSIAEEMGLEPGDKIMAVDGTVIEDVFDFEFLIQDTYIEVDVETKDGEECRLEIEKDFDEDLGIEFENGLMSEYRHCHNKCIFCFIDQMPKGMRENLYFKDDDSRLSFLQGNYITLTNMSEHDIDRIIRYHLAPINISIQTMNPELRCMMLHNRFAGEALKKLDRLYEAGIEMNGQIVLCKGVNDGDELDFSIREMAKYLPYLESVSVVPVGLSKYRDGLYPLQPFNKEDAGKVIDLIESWQKKLYPKFGVHFIHASDEWYILAERPMPEEERYDGYLQLENGVGMVRLFLNEFHDYMEELKKETAIQRISKMALISDFTVVGIGGVDTNATIIKNSILTPDDYLLLKKQGAVGDILSHFIDINGNLIDTDLEKRLMSPALTDIEKYNNVVGVAGGPHKIEAIYAVLTGKYLDVLITDENTATAVLDLYQSKNNIDTERKDGALQ